MSATGSRAGTQAGASASEIACAGLTEVSRVGSLALCTHGPDPAEINTTPAPSPEVAGQAQAETSGGEIVCDGDGVSGKRVQAVYAVAKDQVDRYDDVVDDIRAHAMVADGIFNDSAAETGGSRHVRWVTDAECNLDVAHVVLSERGDDNFAITIAELILRGFIRPDRHYNIWMDAASTYCGIGNILPDDRKTDRNLHNRGPLYARTDVGCWGGKTEAHEIMHTLGGVQLTAPHTTGAWHCYDEYDRMCYSDTSGMEMQYICTDSGHNLRFDCNHDDYYSTDPAEGSYLDTHWNTADSAFLISSDPATANPPHAGSP